MKGFNDPDEIYCTCDGVKQAIEIGIKKMKKQGAPVIAINDFICEMAHGDWINCKCEAGKGGD